METALVSGKGRVTIPKEIRRRLYIRGGSRIAFRLVGDHVEIRLARSSGGARNGGFGMLKSRRAAVPADFDPALLLGEQIPSDQRREAEKRLEALLLEGLDGEETEHPSKVGQGQNRRFSCLKTAIAYQ